MPSDDEHRPARAIAAAFERQTLQERRRQALDPDHVDGLARAEIDLEAARLLRRGDRRAAPRSTHSRSPVDGWTSRYGTALPAASNSRRSARPSIATGVSPWRSTRNRAVAPRSDASMARRCGPVPVVDDRSLVREASRVSRRLRRERDADTRNRNDQPNPDSAHDALPALLSSASTARTSEAPATRAPATSRARRRTPTRYSPSSEPRS